MLIRVTEQVIIWVVILTAMLVPVVTYVQNSYFPVAVVTGSTIARTADNNHVLHMQLEKAGWAPNSVCQFRGNEAYLNQDDVLRRIQIVLRKETLDQTIPPGTYAIGPWELLTANFPNADNVTIEFNHRCLWLFNFKSYANIELGES